MVGQVQRTSIAFRTSEPSSRRYVTKLGPFIVSFSIAICILRWSAPARRFGYHRRTVRQKTLYTTGCTSRRTQWSSSIAMEYIIMRRGTRIRTRPLYLRLISFNSNSDKCVAASHDRFAFKPERFLGDTLNCAESSNLSNAMDRDHWAFGAGCVQSAFLRSASHRPLTFLFRMRRSRRICPAIHVAERELYLTISRLLWAFEIRSLPDEPISLDGYSGESSRRPDPYRITLTPRHDRVQTLLEAQEEVTLMKFWKGK